jgi:hypothetical protein
MELCPAGDDLTCPFTPGVGLSGIQFSTSWMQPEYTGYSARECTIDAECVPDPDGPIGTLPHYFDIALDRAPAGAEQRVSDRVRQLEHLRRAPTPTPRRSAPARSARGPPPTGRFDGLHALTPKPRECGAFGAVGDGAVTVIVGG